MIKSDVGDWVLTCLAPATISRRLLPLPLFARSSTDGFAALRNSDEAAAAAAAVKAAVAVIPETTNIQNERPAVQSTIGLKPSPTNQESLAPPGDQNSKCARLRRRATGNTREHFGRPVATTYR